MALGSINTEKELAITHQPLLLADIVLRDGTITYWSTHGLNTAEGGTPYGGHDYLGRLLEQNINAVQAWSPDGIDTIPSVQLEFADPDRWVWLTYEQGTGKGFRGASLELRLVFYDPLTGEYSTNSKLIFSGICDPANLLNDQVTVVPATSRYALQRAHIPTLRIQKRCPWIFPEDAASRALADVEDTDFWNCGYNPDGGHGNYETGTTPYAHCNLTKEDCTARGMYALHRFGGVTYAVEKRWKSKDWWEKKTIEGENNPNEAKWGEPIPLIYGTAWVQPQILNIIGDANSTRLEAAICTGDICYSSFTQPDNIEAVICNGQVVPFGPYVDSDPLYRWNWVSNGSRDGSPNEDAGYDGKGDPYGSIAVIMIVMPRAWAPSENLPTLLVRVRGPKLRIPNTNNAADWASWPSEHTANPVWVLADLLLWAGIWWDALDIASFRAEAPFCSTLINYKTAEGTTLTHERFHASLALRDRRSAADVVEAFRRSFRAQLLPNLDGKLGLRILKTLGDQQPTDMTPQGSNYATPIASVDSSGSPKNGYVAYSFTAATIAMREGTTNAYSLVIRQRPIGEAVNRVVFTYSDRHNLYQQDLLSMPDPAAIALAKQEVGYTPRVDGVSSTDQARRIAASMMAEANRANPTGEPRGSYLLEWESSVRCIHLRAGDIVRMHFTDYGLSEQLVRLTHVQPSRNAVRMRLAGHIHRDEYYVDTYGQANDAAITLPYRQLAARPAYPWCPHEYQAKTGDRWWTTTYWTFAVQILEETDADGTKRQILLVSGKRPLNQFGKFRVPLLELKGTTASSGGTVPGQRSYYLAVVVLDDATPARYSPGPEYPCLVEVTSLTDLNTITAGVVGWDPDTVNWAIFAGHDPQRLTFQTTGSGKSASVTLTAYQERTWGLPDPVLDHLRLRVKILHHAGVFGAALTGVSTNLFTIAGAGWTPDAGINYDISVLAKADGSEVPAINFLVTDSTATTFTVTPDPAALGLVAGDVITMRSKPTVSGIRLTDALWVNPLSGGAGFNVDEEIGRVLRIIYGPGEGYTYKITDNGTDWIEIEGPWIETPTSASRYIIEDAAWSAPVDSERVQNADPTAGLAIRVPIDNLLEKTILVQAQTVDLDGKTGPEHLAPVREIYVFGAFPGVRMVDDNTTLALSDETLIVDTTAASVTLELLPAALFEGRRCVIRRQDVDPEAAATHVVTINPVGTDTVMGEASAEIVNDGDILELIPHAGDWVKISATSGGAPPGGTTAEEWTLTAPTTEITTLTTPTLGGTLIISLTQDATGGRLITWAAVFDASTSTELAVGPNERTVFWFVGLSDDKWHQMAEQRLEI